MNASTVNIDIDQLTMLLLEALEAELGAIAVYDAAVRCAVHADLRSEWTECLMQAESHRDDLQRALLDAGVDPDQAVPGRAVVAQVSHALLQSIEAELEQGRSDAAQNVALECARLMKRRDRIDWELLAMAVDAVSDEEFADDSADVPVPYFEEVLPFVSPAARPTASNETAAAA